MLCLDTASCNAICAALFILFYWEWHWDSNRATRSEARHAEDVAPTATLFSLSSRARLHGKAHPEGYIEFSIMPLHSSVISTFSLPSIDPPGVTRKLLPPYDQPPFKRGKWKLTSEVSSLLLQVVFLGLIL